VENVPVNPLMRSTPLLTAGARCRERGNRATSTHVASTSAHLGGVRSDHSVDGPGDPEPCHSQHAVGAITEHASDHDASGPARGLARLDSRPHHATRSAHADLASAPSIISMALASP
jgi:hypothetical protein